MGISLFNHKDPFWMGLSKNLVHCMAGPVVLKTGRFLKFRREDCYRPWNSGKNIFAECPTSVK